MIELFVMTSKLVVSGGLMNGPMLAQENWLVPSGRSMFVQVVAAPRVGRLFTRLASIFPENEDSVTPPCVDATHAGLFARVVQSAVPPLGKFVTREASMFPENEDSVTPLVSKPPMPVYLLALSNLPCHH